MNVSNNFEPVMRAMMLVSGVSLFAAACSYTSVFNKAAEPMITGYAPEQSYSRTLPPSLQRANSAQKGDRLNHVHQSAVMAKPVSEPKTDIVSIMAMPQRERERYIRERQVGIDMISRPDFLFTFFYPARVCPIIPDGVGLGMDQLWVKDCSTRFTLSGQHLVNHILKIEQRKKFGVQPPSEKLEDKNILAFQA